MAAITKTTDAAVSKMLNDLFVTGSGSMGTLTMTLLTGTISTLDSITKTTNTAHVSTSVGGAASALGTATVAAESGIPTVTWESETFTFTAATTIPITGYQITDSSDNVVVIHQLETAYSAGQPNDALIITPKLKMGNGTAT